MKNNKIRFCVFAVMVVVVLSSIIAAWGEEGAESNAGPIYVSFLWAGKSDADCMLRDTLITDTSEECQTEYSRAEDEIKTLVNRRNEKGAGWKWGVFAKCSLFKDSVGYNADLEKYRKRCMGK